MLLFLVPLIQPKLTVVYEIPSIWYAPSPSEVLPSDAHDEWSDGRVVDMLEGIFKLHKGKFDLVNNIARRAKARHDILFQDEEDDSDALLDELRLEFQRYKKLHPTDD